MEIAYFPPAESDSPWQFVGCTGSGKRAWLAKMREENRPGAKARVVFAALAARLKSCPDTSGLNLEFFRSLFSPHDLGCLPCRRAVAYRRAITLLLVFALGAAASLGAQQAVDDIRLQSASGFSDAPAASSSDDSALPDTPDPQAAKDKRDPQTKRILGIIPNFRAISTDDKLPAQSVKEKFVTATEDSFDYSSIFIPLLLAVYSQQTNATPEFGHGGPAFARYFWHDAVDQTSENYMVEFVVPVVTHEDTRYYTLFRGGIMKRTGYALSRAVVTRSDSGKSVFNFSEVVGAGASAGLSSLYYPTRERSFGNTGKEWGLDVGIDAASFVAKEFWPDINHWLFHGAKPSAGAQK